MSAIKLGLCIKNSRYQANLYADESNKMFNVTKCGKFTEQAQVFRTKT